MRASKTHHSFTFVEVMVATIILALASVATIAIIGGARASFLGAENRWNDQHVTASVVEYYLLAGPHAGSPSDLLPDGYSSSCQLLDVDDIHEDAQEAINEWQLGELVISVYDNRGNQVSETRMRKLLKTEDFE